MNWRSLLQGAARVFDLGGVFDAPPRRPLRTKHSSRTCATCGRIYPSAVEASLCSDWDRILSKTCGDDETDEDGC